MNRSDEIEAICVADIRDASAYYATVFDAALSPPPHDPADWREMRIGERRYRLVEALGEGDATPHAAPVADVDVAIARAATRGGRILDAAHRTPRGREGLIEDPYGYCWIVSDA